MAMIGLLELHYSKCGVIYDYVELSMQFNIVKTMQDIKRALVTNKPFKYSRVIAAEFIVTNVCNHKLDSA